MTAPLPPPDLAPAGPKRQQRGIQLPQLLLSLLVVAVFALLAVWWQANTTSREPVLALARDVEMGQPITPADLTEIYVSTDIPAELERPEVAEAFVGAFPVSDLEAGTLLNASMFRRSSALAPGQALVGLRLDPTRAPSGLVPGDRVQVLDVADGEQVVELSTDALVEIARVDGDDVIVRLRLDTESAQQVQVRSNQVVLIEVDNSGLASWETEGPS